MKRTEILGNTDLPGVLWLPEGECRAVLQVVHGMTEHIGRYEKFAEELTASGIAVAGFDLPGHGKNPGNSECASMGEQGWNRALEQIEAVNRELLSKIPGVPLCLMGFSLGSFIVRDYLSKSQNAPAKVIIMGSGDQPSFVLSSLKALVKGQIKKAGFDRTTELVKQLSFGAYNKNFAPNRTAADWLCADSHELDSYLSDPLCRKSISSGLFYQLLDGMQRTGSDTYVNWKKDMPVLLISGSDDPVGNAGKGMKTVQKKMKSGGLTDVILKLIPGARHDLLHEIAGGGAIEATNEIISFLLK